MSVRFAPERSRPEACAIRAPRLIGVRLRSIGPAAVLLAVTLTACRSGPQLVSFPTPDRGFVHADDYGDGDHGVVLAHGGGFDRSSWAAQAQRLAREGYRALSIDFRGRGQSRGGDQEGAENAVHLDVMAAVRYLRRAGVETVSVVGASVGGWAAAQAAVEAPAGEIDRLVLLAASPIQQPERLQGRKLFLVARDDTQGATRRRLPQIRDQYERAPGPKELVIFEGSAHAQLLFETEQGEALMGEILRFLGEP